MNDPEIALKNAVFEYLLATNNVKSAEVFFNESNLASQYNVSVDVMVHNTQQYGNSCLICKLFNNWYSFAQNQRNITPQPSVLLHSNQKDENLLHMQQFLQFYHTHDHKHNDPNHDCHTHNNINNNINNNSINNENINNIDNNDTFNNINSFNNLHNNGSDTNNDNFNNMNGFTNLNNDNMNLDSLSPHPSSPPHTHLFHTSTHTTTTTTTTSSFSSASASASSALASTSSPVMIPNQASFHPPNGISPSALPSPTSPISSSTDSLASSPGVAGGGGEGEKATGSGGDVAISDKENEFLFAVERKLFNNNNSAHESSSSISQSDALLQLLTLNSISFPASSSSTSSTSLTFSPQSSSPSLSTTPPNAMFSPTLTRATTDDLAGVQEDNFVEMSEVDTSADTPSKNGRFCCPYPNCTKSFSTSAILKRHIKEHSGDRPYKCSFEGCGKGFARNYDLKVHMRSHTGEKPYRCTFMGCERTFTRSSDLRLHERIHKGEKPFVCDCAGCQKRFVRYADLKKHKRTHEVHEGHHPHVHGAGCGHTAIAHEDHIDYLHDAHLHNPHKDHIDDHKIGLSESNPNTCTEHVHSEAFVCDPTHTHNDSCGHELVPHYDHYDYLVDGHLHYVHDSHCDDHGWIDVVNWNPSDFTTASPSGAGPSPSSSPNPIPLIHHHHHHEACG